MRTPTTPDNYRHHTALQIRYGDLDTLGHVNNSRFLTYLEQARITYFADHTLGGGQPLWDGSLSAHGMIVAKITVEYKLPLQAIDHSVDVWTRISRLGNKSFEMTHLVNRSADAATAATGHIVVVCFDYVADQSIPIPSAWREHIITYEPALSIEPS